MIPRLQFYYHVICHGTRGSPVKKVHHITLCYHKDCITNVSSNVLDNNKLQVKFQKIRIFV
ncbi:hypothetical protein HanRHA438_Chr16g0784371 [Helianthus annuus]|nr:hypothetical protein HanIR_Chr16g0839831 [Helianthus annuus]KAJ0838011.1 hypothetical protein HanRHA438_Chr16g0784371 [Helianthus annuus]